MNWCMMENTASATAVRVDDDDDELIAGLCSLSRMLIGDKLCAGKAEGGAVVSVAAKPKRDGVVRIEIIKHTTLAERGER